MSRNPINFLYNSGHVTLSCVEVGPVAYAREGSMQEYVRKVGAVDIRFASLFFCPETTVNVH